MSEQANQPQPQPEVHTAVSPSLHPNIIRSYGLESSPNSLGRKAFDAAFDALDTSYKVIGAINDTERQLKETAAPNAAVYRGANGQLTHEYGAEQQMAEAAEKAAAAAANKPKTAALSSPAPDPAANKPKASEASAATDTAAANKPKTAPAAAPKAADKAEKKS